MFKTNIVQGRLLSLALENILNAEYVYDENINLKLTQIPFVAFDPSK